MLLEILIAIIIIILILLYLGVRIIASWEKVGPKLEFDFKILIFSKIKLYHIEYPSNKGNNEPKKDEDEEDKNHDIKNILKLAKPTINPFIEFFKKILYTIQVKEMENHLNFGMDSYVDTAKYVGYMWAILVFPNTLFKNTNLSVEPNFTEPIFDFKGECDIKINLLKIISPTITLLKNKDVRKLIKILIKGEENGDS